MVTLRPLQEHECDAASALCLKSKAHWGYDAGFMAACRAELTIAKEDLARDPVVAAVLRGRIVGVAQISVEGNGYVLEKLFVDPAHMGRGIGRRLFAWALETAEGLGARELIVEADPDAAPFYERMGCVAAGFAPSGSIPGRRLPRLVWKVRASG